MKIHGIKREWSHPIFCMKKHYCTRCGEMLEKTKTETVVNSKSEEAKNYDFSQAGGDGFMIGNVKFIRTAFRCNKCGKTYSVEKLVKIERIRHNKESLPEENLIEYAKSYLKAKGFKKKNKRWTKDVGDFTLCFYIQGSCYSKEDYYIRPGIFINGLLPTDEVYGHLCTEIDQTTPQEILCDFEQWCENWTDKSVIKKRLLAFTEWEKRNPVKKRRADLVDYKSDPNPAYEFFGVTSKTKQYILDNF